MKDSSLRPVLGGLASAVVALGTLRAMHSRSRAHRHKLSWETCSSECAGLQVDALARTHTPRDNLPDEETAPWIDNHGVFHPVSESLEMPTLCDDAKNCTCSDSTSGTTPTHWPMKAQHINGMGYFGITQGERPSRAQLSRKQLDAIGSGDVTPPLFRFGAIADIQYGDFPVTTTRGGVAVRVYQHSLCALNRAILSWNLVPGGLQFVAQLGDIIDGKNAKVKEGSTTTHRALNRVMDSFERCTATADHHHIVGNHELYNFERSHLRDAPPHKELAANYSYHSFVAHPKWRVIALDAFEIGVVGWPEGHPNQISAWKLLDHHNHNNCRSNGVNWVSGMRGLKRRFLPYNGGVGASQLEWLGQELDAAKEEGQRVIVLSHMPIHPGATSADCLIWNYDQVLEVLHKRGRGSVVAVFAGHYHSGGLSLDEAGVHHVTMPSPLEGAPPLTSHAVVDVHESVLLVRGSGRVPTRALRIFDREDAAEVKEIRQEMKLSQAQDTALRTGYSVDECMQAVEACDGAHDAIAGWLKDRFPESVRDCKI